MSTISAKLIKNPRSMRFCELCHKLIMDEQIRLYGFAERGDKPYSIYVHPECYTEKNGPKLKEAKKERSNER